MKDKKNQQMQQEAKPSPEALLFFTFINIITTEGKAEIHDKSDKVLLMGTDLSNLFICGKDETSTPFIGIENSFIPWFTHLPWTEVAISFKKGYIYLISTEDNGNIIISIGFKIRRKRMLVLCDPTKHNKTDTLNLKVFKYLDNKNMSLSSKNIQNNITITIVDDITEIIDREFSDDPFSFEDQGFVSDFTNIKINK